MLVRGGAVMLSSHQQQQEVQQRFPAKLNNKKAGGAPVRNVVGNQQKTIQTLPCIIFCFTLLRLH
jgi:hypothetical protein